MDRDQPGSVRCDSVAPPHASSRRGASRRRQSAAAIVETIIALPILLVVILAAIQFGLVYQAKATLNHASLQAARAGAVSNASAAAIRQGLARGLLPLSSPDHSLEGVVITTAQIEAQLATDARVRILNPTREAFADFAEGVDGQKQIPNDRLHARSTTEGSASGLSIQDANLLKLEVTYGYPLRVPIVGWFVSHALLRIDHRADAFSQQLLRRSRLPILAGATVRMQSPARISNLVAARSELPDVQRSTTETGAVDQDPDSTDAADARADEDDKPGGSSLGDSFLGFGNGRQIPVEAPTGSSPKKDAAVDRLVPAARAPPEHTPPAPLCTPAKNGATNDANKDSGVLGQIWGELKNLAGTAVEFIKGFWEGIKEQLHDLVEVITDPLEVAKGLYQLAREFIEDPPGTARTIGAAIGKDLQQLISCGAFDRGRVLGSNVDPAFMLKLATKLAKFGRLAHALDETKRAFGCASFAAGTVVWNGDERRSIDEIHGGDLVTSRDRTTLHDGPREVGRTFHRTAPGYFAVVTEAEVLQVTAEHPVWVQGAGWTEVRDLRPGDPLATRDGDVLVRESIAVVAPKEVFNLSIPGTESYFVGTGGLWVHNAKCEIPPIYRAPHSPSGYAIGASDGGSGSWMEINRPDTAAYRYEKQITGAPRNVEYDIGGVKFDGYDAERDVLVDAKRWTEDCPLSDCKPAALRGAVADKLVKEAMDQIEAVTNSPTPDTPIEWHVANKLIASKMEEILKERFRSQPEYTGRITIIFTPDISN